MDHTWCVEEHGPSPPPPPPPRYCSSTVILEVQATDGSLHIRRALVPVLLNRDQSSRARTLFFLLLIIVLPRGLYY